MNTWPQDLLEHMYPCKKKKNWATVIPESTILKSWKNKSIGTNARIKFRLVGLPVTSAAIGNFGENKAEVQLGQKTDCIRLSGPEVCLVKACVVGTPGSPQPDSCMSPPPPPPQGVETKKPLRADFYCLFNYVSSVLLNLQTKRCRTFLSTVICCFWRAEGALARMCLNS